MENKFEIVDGDKTYYLKRPTAEQEAAARAASARVFNEAVKRGDFFRAALDQVMRDQGVWNDEKEARVKEIEDKLYDYERKLLKGGIAKKKAVEIAKSMRQLRWESIVLRAVRRQYDANTIEGQQENYEFDFLMTQCLVDDEDEPVFKSVEEYRKSNDKFATEAANKLGEVHYGLNPKWQHDLPENKFFKRFELVDEDLRFVDGSGNFLTPDGKLVDEKGRLVDEDGNFIDEKGNRVDENGNPVEEFSPFLDDDGNPITTD